MPRISSHFQLYEKGGDVCGYSSGKTKKTSFFRVAIAFFRVFHVINDRGKQRGDRGFLGLVAARVGRYYLSISPPPISMPKTSKLFGFICECSKKNCFRGTAFGMEIGGGEMLK